MSAVLRTTLSSTTTHRRCVKPITPVGIVVSNRDWLVQLQQKQHESV